MNLARTALAAALAAPLAVIAACDGADPTAPPNIRYGEAVCIDCNMIISDARFATVAIVEDERGRPQPYLYDDVGDQIRHEAADPSMKILARWVHDFDTGEWLRAEDAVYLRSRDIYTPMASGIVSFADLPAAKALQAEAGGRILTFRQVWNPQAAEPHHVHEPGHPDFTGKGPS